MSIRESGSPPPLRKVEWCGDSRDTVRRWPKDVKLKVGDQLTVVQLGEFPDRCEALSDVGNDVYALRVQSSGEQYRVLWIAKLNDNVYVLHAFHKKSKSGIATPDQEKGTARRRLIELRQQIPTRTTSRRN